MSDEDTENESANWCLKGRDVGARPYPLPAWTEHVRTGERIPLPGGLELVADLYVPAGEPPFPAIVEITPYGAQRSATFGRLYRGRGYLYLAVDARGRYRSAGTWEPLTHDRSDGHAVLSWMATHELCNGRLGTRGHSYCGSNQLLAAIDAPPALQAMSVVVAPGDPFENVPFQGGAYDLNDLSWLLDMTGRVCTPDEREKIGEGFEEPRFREIEDGETDEDEENGDEEQDEDDSPIEREHDALIDAAIAARPFGEIDLRLGVRHETFRTWIRHWSLDDFWKERCAGRHLDRTAVATLFVSGWWDGNGRGAPVFFRGMRESAAAQVREKQRLVIGPWDHDLRAPDCDGLPEHEEQLVERGALREVLNDELAWFDQHLRDIPPGPSSSARVTLFLTGAYRWVELEDWPPPHSREWTLFLAGARKGRVGALVAESDGSSPRSSSYTLDPDDPTPFGPHDVDAERMPFDQAAIHRERRDLLLFDSAPAEQEIALVGDVALHLFAAADAPDFDLCAKLLDVHPDGRVIFLTDGILRARFREGFERQVLVEPGVAHEYHLDLWHVGHVLRPGHRLRVEVASAAFLRFDVNACTGADPATDVEARGVRVELLHDSEHPSRLVLTRWDT